MQRLVELEVKLQEPFKAGVGGKETEVKTVLLIAPSGKHRKLASRLKRICASTMMGETKNHKDEKGDKKKEDDEDTKIKWTDLINLLSSASDADPDLFDDIYDTFFALLKDGCGSIGGSPLTDYIFDKMAYCDLEKLVGEYVVNFLFESLTRNQDGKK